MVYSVYFIDIAGSQNVDCAYVSKTEALSAIDRLLYGPGRMVVKEIKCVDALDRLVWHCRDGIVWPDEPDSTPINQPTSHQETTSTKYLSLAIWARTPSPNKPSPVSP